MNTAAMLIGRRDYDMAEAILQPLASHPHSEELAQAARQMIDQVRAARAAAPAAASTNSPLRQ